MRKERRLYSGSNASSWELGDDLKPGFLDQRVKYKLKYPDVAAGRGVTQQCPVVCLSVRDVPAL